LNTLQEQRDFIEKLVKSNNKFGGNEDLFDDFCSETYKRSHSLLEDTDVRAIAGYLAKVTNTAILTVLKENGRVRRRENRYVSTNEVLLNPLPTKTISDTIQTQTQTIVSDIDNNFVYQIADPRDSFEEKIVRKDLLQKIVDIVLAEQKQNPNKEFLKIFYLRYVKEKKQREIAEELNLSQSEISKRLIEISQIVKSHF
jgi:RNA polymerase sigma factor (sigma-70 family)